MVKVTMNPQSLLLTPNIFVEDLFDDSFQFGGKEGQLELQFLQQNVLIITVVVRIIMLVMMIVTIALHRKDGGLMNTVLLKMDLLKVLMTVMCALKMCSW